MKKMLIILLICLLALTSVACNKEPIKIGYIGNLSSKTSQLAIDARNGIELRIEQLNSQGGLNGTEVQLVVKDDAADHEQALKMHQEFKDEGVKFIIGHITSDMASVIAASQGEELLFMSPSISTDSLSAKDDYFLRTSPINSRQGDIISRYFHKKNIKDIVVIYDLSNREYTENLYLAFEEYYSNDDFKIKEVITFDSRTDDMEIVSNQLNSLVDDDVFLITQATDTAFLIQKLKLEKENIHAYSVSWSMTSDLLAIGGSSVEDAIFIGLYIPDEVTSRYQEFSEDFQARFNAQPTFISVLAYDALDVLLKGMDGLKKPTPESVKNRITEIEEFQALQLTFRMDKFGDNDREYMLYQLRDGEFVPLRDW